MKKMLLGLGGAAALLFLGCSSQAEDAPSSILMKEPASAETTRDIGVSYWEILEWSDGDIETRGLDEQGFERFSMALAASVNREHKIYEVTTSNGGLLRVSSSGEVLESAPDVAGFAAVNRDLKDLAATHGADVSAYGCDAAGWASCLGALALLGLSCPDPLTVEICILSAGVSVSACVACL